MGIVVGVLKTLPDPVKRALKKIPLLSRMSAGMYAAAGDQIVALDHGFSLALDMRSPTQRAYATARPAEAHVTTHLDRTLEPGGCAIDVGGYVGFMTMVMARAVGPTGRVLTFEPLAENAARIRRSAALNRFEHVTVVEAALSDHDGTERIYLEREAGGSPSSTSSLRGNGEAAEVTVVTLDAFADSEGIDRIDLVKIDVEGAESEVVAGMGAILRRLRPELVIEFSSRAAAAGCISLLADHGYSVTELGITRHGLHLSATADDS